MRVLSLVYLMAVAASVAITHSSSTANAQRNDFCPGGSITNSRTTVSMDTPGAVYYAAQCTVVDYGLVTLYAQESPSIADGADRTANRITASVAGSTFNEGSQVLVALPKEANIATTVPVHVYVQNNKFLSNACIRFYGSYPRDSKLVISGNTIANAAEPSRFPTMTSQVAGILGWQSDNGNFVLLQNAKIEISNNDINVDTTNKNYEARGIGLWNYVYLHEGASVSINNNKVRVKAVTQKFNGGIDTFAYIAEGKNTFYEMLGNEITTFNGFAIGAPFARYPSTDAEEMRFPTRVLVSRNNGTINKALSFPTSKSDGDVIFVGNSKNSLTSTIEISYNDFKVLGSDGNIRVAQTELRDTAQVKVLANTITTTGGNPRIIFSWNMSAYDDSQVIVTHNTARRVDFNEFYPGSFFLYYRGYNLYNRSVSHFSQNVFRAESNLRKAYLLDRYPEMPFTLHSSDCFKMCDNEYYSSVLNTDEKVMSTMPDYVTPYVAPRSACPAQPFATPTLPSLDHTAVAFFDATAETVAPTTTKPVTVLPNPDARANGVSQTEQQAFLAIFYCFALFSLVSVMHVAI